MILRVWLGVVRPMRLVMQKLAAVHKSALLMFRMALIFRRPRSWCWHSTRIDLYFFREMSILSMNHWRSFNEDTSVPEVWILNLKPCGTCFTLSFVILPRQISLITTFSRLYGSRKWQHAMYFHSYISSINPYLRTSLDVACPFVNVQTFTNYLRI